MLQHEGNTAARALADCIRYLAQRAHSRKELIDKLKKKGYGSDTIEATLSRLETLGLIDDQAFGRSCMASLARRRPEGRLKTRQRLLQKGLDDGAVEELLGELDEKALCRSAAEKKMRSLSGASETKRKKLETFLRNRGFDWHTIRETVEQLMADH